APPSAPAPRSPGTPRPSSSRCRARSSSASRPGRSRKSSRAERGRPASTESRLQGSSAMCGIVTAISTRNVVPVLIEGLRKLEYRGYDSAGLAVLSGELTRLRAAGRVAELAALADARELSAHIG